VSVSQHGEGLVPEPVLEDGTVRLRRWTVMDLACVKAASDEGVIPESTSVPYPFTEKAGREWIERQHSRVVRGHGWSLAVTEMPRGPAVGCTVLLLRPQEGVAGLGYWIVPSARGRGLASLPVVPHSSCGRLGFSRLNTA
jgi:[ribosomal protein S5]-alanine N-acetyltransferase